MSKESANIVICGAGIAGVSAAFHLAVRNGVKGIVLVDERPPLTLTSDKSTECYRNWWPGPGDAMGALANRSIDLLEQLARETDNAFLMNRRGYLFATAENGAALIDAARETTSLGASAPSLRASHERRTARPSRRGAARDSWPDETTHTQMLCLIVGAAALKIAITGSNSGIGLAASRKLLADGHDIIHACRSSDA